MAVGVTQLSLQERAHAMCFLALILDPDRDFGWVPRRPGRKPRRTCGKTSCHRYVGVAAPGAPGVGTGCLTGRLTALYAGFSDPRG